MLCSLMCRHSYQTWNDFAILMLDLQFGHQRETDGASCHGPQHKQRLLSSHFSRMEMVAHSVARIIYSSPPSMVSTVQVV
jgi:hypothetical protein